MLEMSLSTKYRQTKRQEIHQNRNIKRYKTNTLHKIEHNIKINYTTKVTQKEI